MINPQFPDLSENISKMIDSNRRHALRESLGNIPDFTRRVNRIKDNYNISTQFEQIKLIGGDTILQKLYYELTLNDKLCGIVITGPEGCGKSCLARFLQCCQQKDDFNVPSELSYIVKTEDTKAEKYGKLLADMLIGVHYCSPLSDTGCTVYDFVCSILLSIQREIPTDLMYETPASLADHLRIALEETFQFVPEYLPRFIILDGPEMAEIYRGKENIGFTEEIVRLVRKIPLDIRIVITTRLTPTISERYSIINFQVPLLIEDDEYSLKFENLEINRSPEEMKTIKLIFEVIFAAISPLKIAELWEIIDHITDIRNMETIIRNHLPSFLIIGKDKFVTFRSLGSKSFVESLKDKLSFRNGNLSLASWLMRRKCLTGDEAYALAHYLLKSHLNKEKTDFFPNLPKNVIYGNCVRFCAANLNLLNYRAYNYSNEKIYEILLMAGADANVCLPTCRGESILCKWATSGSLQIVKMLIKYGANVNWQDKSGKTALLYAGESGSCSVISFLLQNGADIFHVDNHKYSVLHYSTIFGHFESVKAIIQAITVKDKKSVGRLVYSAFVHAIMWNHIAIWKYFINELDFPLNQVDEVSRQTALTAALQSHINDNLFDLINNVLIKEVNTPNTDGDYPLQVGLSNTDVPDNIICLLISRTNSPHFSNFNSNGHTFLMTALKNERSLRIIKKLYSQDTINLIGEGGRSSLHFAAEYCSKAVISLLLKNGGNARISDDFGRIPLHYAVSNSDLTHDAVTLLCKFTYNVNICDSKGLSPLDYSLSEDNLDFADILLKFGAKITSDTWDLCAGKFDIIIILLQKLVKDCRYCISVSQFHPALERVYRIYKKIRFLVSQTTKEEEINYLLDLKYTVLIYSVICLINTNNYGPAINITSKAISMFPEKFDGYYYRAKTLYLSGQVEASRSDFEKASSLDPSRREIQNFYR